MTVSKYRHKLLKYFLIFFTAFIPVIINRTYILEGILYNKARFYPDLITALITNIIAWDIFRRFHNYLNKKLPIEKKLALRAIIQFSVSLVIGLSFVYLIYYLYCNFVIHVPVSKVINPKSDLLVIILVIIFANAYYIGYLFYNKWSISLNQITDQKNDEQKKDFLLVNSGQETFPLIYTEIATIFLEGKTSFLITFTKKQYILNESLKFYENILLKKGFFRINRQYLINQKNIKSFKTIENGKIEVSLLTEETISIVSQKNASEFRTWIKS